MTHTIGLLVQVVGCAVVADLLSGFFHWLEDCYGREEWPITGRVITTPNVLHHRNPAYFTRHSWLRSASVLLVMGGSILAAAHLCGMLGWRIVLVVAIGVNANEIHKWAHRSPSENGWLITKLQAIGLLLSPAHHAQHHSGYKNSHYCVVTDYLNPLLDGVHLWDSLESTVYKLLGIARRVDNSLDARGLLTSGCSGPRTKVTLRLRGRFALGGGTGGR